MRMPLFILSGQEMEDAAMPVSVPELQRKNKKKKFNGTKQFYKYHIQG